MLRPSARIAKASALAAASTSPSLRSISGKANAATAIAATAIRRPAGLRTRSRKATSGGLGASSGVAVIQSGPARRRAAENPGRAEHQDENQDREDDDIGPADREELAAQRLDEPDQDAAEHGARDVADPAEHRRGERPQARRVADDEAGIVVIETEDQAGGA